MLRSRRNPLGLRIIELPPQLTRKSAYSANELELFQTAAEQLDHTKSACAQMFEDARCEIELLKKEAEVQVQAECLEQLHINLDNLQRQQLEHEQKIIDHCIAIIERAWKKLTNTLPAYSQIESLLNQVKNSLIEGVYHVIECNPADLQHVEDYVRNLKTAHLHLDHVELVTCSTLESGRIRLKAHRGGITMIDYSFAVESIAQTLRQTDEKYTHTSKQQQI